MSCWEKQPPIPQLISTDSMKFCKANHRGQAGPWQSFIGRYTSHVPSCHQACASNDFGRQDRTSWKTHTNMKGFVELVGGVLQVEVVCFFNVFVLVRPWLLVIVAACCLLLGSWHLMTLQTKAGVPSRQTSTTKITFCSWLYWTPWKFVLKLPSKAPSHPTRKTASNKNYPSYS